MPPLTGGGMPALVLVVVVVVLVVGRGGGGGGTDPGSARARRAAAEAAMASVASSVVSGRDWGIERRGDDNDNDDDNLAFWAGMASPRGEEEEGTVNPIFVLVCFLLPTPLNTATRASVARAPPSIDSAPGRDGMEAPSARDDDDDHDDDTVRHRIKALSIAPSRRSPEVPPANSVDSSTNLADLRRATTTRSSRSRSRSSRWGDRGGWRWRRLRYRSSSLSRNSRRPERVDRR
mmetsp:Transcript_21562/g.63204  ORF Transcript_21562/g.63204 Transcript_21562/m.63204 type:complete len:234 (-) Transcript_21562:196-897(-)